LPRVGQFNRQALNLLPRAAILVYLREGGADAVVEFGDVIVRSAQTSRRTRREFDEKMEVSMGDFSLPNFLGEVFRLRNMLWAAIALLILWIAAAIVLPLCGVSRHIIELEHPIKIADYGTWLSGSLTPAVFAVALLSFFAQKSGQDESNRIQNQTLILTHVHELYGRLNYMAACVIVDDVPPPGSVRYGNLQEVDRLLKILCSRGKDDEKTPHLPAKAADARIFQGDYFSELLRNLRSTVKIMEKADLKFMYDKRIFALLDAMEGVEPKSAP
jgi:hypothetical protein